MRTRRSNLRDSARRGFTLMELLTVMIIMVLMMSIATVSFFKARQGAEMRGAERAVQTTISLARQQAVVKRTRFRLTFANTTNINGNLSGCMILESVRSSTTAAAYEIKYLPPKITFDATPVLTFETDGSAGIDTEVIKMTQNYSPAIKKSLTFNRLIGTMVEN